mmetsp:Transcript_52050/g.116843  ORF Transcript_52050/g.116843 Transcript_52050/m.116843 type:complete len:109 (-) Transcript_52050:236-562(-)
MSSSDISSPLSKSGQQEFANQLEELQLHVQSSWNNSGWSWADQKWAWAWGLLPRRRRPAVLQALEGWARGLAQAQWAVEAAQAAQWWSLDPVPCPPLWPPNPASTSFL